MTLFYFGAAIVEVSLLIFTYRIGKKRGRQQEYRAWSNEMLPTMKRLEQERNALWRSAVSKKQKLNRIRRHGGI